MKVRNVKTVYDSRKSIKVDVLKLSVLQGLIKKNAR